MVTFSQGKAFSLLLVISLSQNFFLQAQQHYSLQDLVSISRNYLPSIKQRQALLNSAKASVTDTRHSFLPQLRASEQLNIGSDNSLAGSYFTYGITPSTSAGVRAANSLQAVSGNIAVVAGEYELANFGLNKAKLQFAESLVHLQETDLAKEGYYIQLEVARLYFNLLRNQYKLRADAQNVERYQRIYAIITALTSSGIKAGADSSLAKAELSKTRISYNQTAGRIAQLKEQLSLVTGIPSDQLLLDSVSSLAGPAVTITSAIDTTSHPLLQYYRQRKQLYSDNEKLIHKMYQPRILLSVATWARGSSIQFNDQFKSLAVGLSYQRFNYALGLAFSYNLLNGLYKKDKLAINRFQAEASAFEYEQQRVSLESAEKQVAAALRTVQSNLKELPVQLQAAQDTYQQKLAQYKAGIISLIDLTNASFVLYRSQTDYIETLNDWYVSQLEQAAAAGRLFQFIQTIK